MTTTERHALRAAAMAAMLCLAGKAAAQEPEAAVAEVAADSEAPVDAAESAAPGPRTPHGGGTFAGRKPPTSKLGNLTPEQLERRLDIWEYQVEGNTALKPEEIEAAVTPFLGPQRKVADIGLAMEALEEAYRQKGYGTVGVQLPEQDVRSGVVRLGVSELRVGRLRVSGSRYYSPERIREGVPSLAEGEVPRYDEVTQDIARINQARDRTITPTLRAGAAPNTVDVDLEVEDQLPLHGSLEINDRYTTNTRRLRMVGSVSYANLFQRDHSLSLQTQFAPQDLDQTLLLSASYLMPFPRKDFSLVFYGVHSESDVAAVGGIDVIGSGDIFGVRGVWNIVDDKTIHTFLAGVDYKNFQEDLVLGNDTAATPIDYIPFTLEYSLNHAGKSGDSELRASLNGNTRTLGSDNLEFDAKRDKARANYLFSRVDLKRNQRLPGEWRLLGSVSGQIASGPLISNEGFGVGGWDSVRGYLESQEVGDSGVRASLQLETPSQASLFGGWMQDARAFAFYDWAEIYLDDAIVGGAGGTGGGGPPVPTVPGTPAVSGHANTHASIYSVGLGLRLQAFKTLNLETVLAAPLKNEEALDLDFDDRIRAQFRLWAEF
jgi:hemolysin activation/secretion protein